MSRPAPRVAGHFRCAPFKRMSHQGTGWRWRMTKRGSLKAEIGRYGLLAAIRCTVHEGPQRAESASRSDQRKVLQSPLSYTGGPYDPGGAAGDGVGQCTPVPADHTGREIAGNQALCFDTARFSASTSWILRQPQAAGEPANVLLHFERVQGRQSCGPDRLASCTHRCAGQNHQVALRGDGLNFMT